MLPGAAVSEQKRNYGTKDLSDWIRYWNAVNVQEGTMEKPIEFYYTDNFPIRSPTLLRCAIVDPSCIPALCTFPLPILSSTSGAFAAALGKPKSADRIL
jgi:hypothetical protein